MLGQQAPDFALQNQDGKLVHLSDYRGSKVILFAFVRANTGGCNAQACSFRDEFPEFHAANAVVLGISPDSVKLLLSWKEQKQLPYDLLSDPNHAVLEAWGAWGVPFLSVIKVPMVNRAVWIIDENGMVIEEQLGVEPYESVRRALAAVGEAAVLR